MPPLIERTPIQPIEGVVPSPTQPMTFSRTPPAVSLYLETAKGSDEWVLATDIDWSGINLQLDAQDDTATLILRALDASKLAGPGAIGTRHFKHILDDLHPDKRVRIAMGMGADAPIFLFQGYPMSRTPSWSEKHQALTCTCLSEGQELLRSSEKTQIVGRKMRYSSIPLEVRIDDLVDVGSDPPVFNAKGKPNRAQQLHSLTVTDSEGFSHALFPFTTDDAPKGIRNEGETQFWSAANALRYVVWHYVVQAGVGEVRAMNALDFLRDTDRFVGMEPAEDSQDPFMRKMTARLNNVSIQAMNAEQAIGAICAAVGLHFHLEMRADGSQNPQFYLRVFAALEKEGHESPNPPEARRMGFPRILDIPRDAPFANYSGLTPADIGGRNEARQAQLVLDDRAVNAPVFLGGAKEFQVTLLLRPGWLPHINVDNVVTTPPADPIGFWEGAFGYDDTVDEFTVDIDRFNSVYHAKHPNFRTVADVWRLWVFPDDESYMNADLATSPYTRQSPWDNPLLWSPYDSSFDHLVYAEGDLGGSAPIDEVRLWSPHRRPFLPTIGRINLATSSRDPIVWLNFHATDPFAALADLNWVRYTGNPKIDAKRAAIWFPDDNLWASPNLRENPQIADTGIIDAYLGLQEDGTWGAPHFMVAVTCTVRGDVRMVHRPSPAGSSLSRRRTQTIDLGFERFVNRKTIAPPIEFPSLAKDETDPAFKDRDDTDAFTKHCNRVAEATAHETVSGSWEAPYVKTDVRLGDSFSGVEGLGIAFGSYPECVAIEFSKDEKAGYRTVYHLSDLRHAPELGAE